MIAIVNIGKNPRITGGQHLHKWLTIRRKKQMLKTMAGLFLEAKKKRVVIDFEMEDGTTASFAVEMLKCELSKAT